MSVYTYSQFVQAFRHTACTLIHMANFEYEDLTQLHLGQLADRRDWQLSRVDKTTEALKLKVREAYDEGKSIKWLAKECGVTRRTIYAWLDQ